MWGRGKKVELLIVQKLEQWPLGPDVKSGKRLSTYVAVGCAKWSEVREKADLSTDLDQGLVPNE